MVGNIVIYCLLAWTLHQHHLDLGGIPSIFKFINERLMIDQQLQLWMKKMHMGTVDISMIIIISIMMTDVIIIPMAPVVVAITCINQIDHRINIILRQVLLRILESAVHLHHNNHRHSSSVRTKRFTDTNLQTLLHVHTSIHMLCIALHTNIVVVAIMVVHPCSIKFGHVI